LKEVDDRYPALLRKHEEEARQKRLLAAAAGDTLASAEPTPSELAYTEILNLSRMKHVFPNLDWETLRNKRSEWKNGHFHPVVNDTDSEDFDAEIERQFPAPPE
jgi:REP element-mobilizing transposase RayT